MQNNLIINLRKYSIIIILLFLLLKSNKPFAALKLAFLAAMALILVISLGLNL